MNRLGILTTFLLTALVGLTGCMNGSSYDCQFPPQAMRFCVIDSTLPTPASWITPQNKDSLFLYSVKAGQLDKISFTLDSLTYETPIVISYPMANLAASSDTTRRIREFRLYASKKLDTDYLTILMDIRKSEDPNCVFYIYYNPMLNGRFMTLHPLKSYWVGAIQQP